MNPTDAMRWILCLCQPFLRLSHAKTLRDLVVAGLTLDRASFAELGRRLARGTPETAKSGIKRVDRFVGNSLIEPTEAMRPLIQWLAEPGKPLLVSVDWVELRRFHCLVLAVHFSGRALPLLWAVYRTEDLYRSQNYLEYGLLRVFRTMVPETTPVTLLADRGFGRAENCTIQQSTINPYVGYSYAYPHKTAYRSFERPFPLQEAWAGERLDRLFMYLHVPFCTGRCSYCNLFSICNSNPEQIQTYVNAIERQAETVMEILPSARFARFAMGGGTPTVLSIRLLERLFGIIQKTFRCDLAEIPTSVEISPESASREKLEFLRETGIERISLGVQTFLDRESKALGRRQSSSMIEQVLKDIRDIGFPILNMDLIYGGPLQTRESWRTSLETALRYEPEELYLYPLYVRQHTPLFKSYCLDQDRRLESYRIGRDTLGEGNYIQESMRMFRRRSVYKEQGPAYCCQEDGMIGIGCGARSYTRQTHYSSEYAAHPEQISQIIDHFIQQTDFHLIRYGILLNPDEQRRRYIIKSLLRCKGLDRHAYHVQFHSDPVEDYLILRDLEQQGLVMIEPQEICLTQQGLEVSDAIGPAFYSPAIRKRMESFVWL